MWQCPKCQAHNEGNFCARCGIQKPVIAASVNEQNIPKQSGQNVRQKSNSGKKSVLVAICIILAMVSVVSLSVAALSLMNQNNEPELKVTINKDVQTKEAQVSEGKEEVSAEEADKQGKEEKSDEETLPVVVEKAEEKEPEEAEETKPLPYEPEEGETAKYFTYTNSEFDFYCAYPADFNSVEAAGINALKSYVSKDGRAEMTIRADVNSANINAQQALNEFYDAFDGEITYQAKGESWYAISIRYDDKAFYRKFFIDRGNIYCMDFEMYMDDLDKYGPYIEYIEDNFKTYD